MDDGWGASVDPWSSNPTPADILGQLDADEKLNIKAPPTTRRRASSAVDPWSTNPTLAVEPEPSLPVWGSSVAAGKPSPSFAFVHPAPRSPASAPAWMNDNLDDGWGTPEPAAATFELSQATDGHVDRSSPILSPSKEGEHIGDSEPTTAPINAHISESLSPSPLPPSPPPPFAPVHDLTQSAPPSPIAPRSPVTSWQPELEEDSFVLPHTPHRLESPNSTANPALPSFASLPASPAQEDGGFGGFSSAPADELDTGWGRTDLGGSWGIPSLPDPLPNMKSFESPSDATGNEIDGWGETAIHGIPLPEAAQEEERAENKAGMEDEWEAERRAVERRESRAPAGYVRELQLSWSTLAEQIYPELAGGDASVGTKADLDIASPGIDTRLSDLIITPSAINTFVQPFHSTLTWSKYRSALNDNALAPETSLLARAARSSTIRSSVTQVEDWERQWGVRSHLGEPELEQKNVLAVPEGPRPGWSLWSKKGSNVAVPLTTSGGGALELKRASSDQPVTRDLAVPAASSSMSANPTSTFDFMASPPSGPSADTRPSSQIVSNPALLSESPIAPATAAPTPRPDSPGDPAPSAVGRFFGRFRKSRPASPSVDLGTKDLALSADDFSFLADVPSIPVEEQRRESPGFMDLLSLEGNHKPNEDIASLEAVLNTKSTRLPSALAPPPPPARASSAASRTSNNQQSIREFDLFNDLDFGPTPTAQPQFPSMAPHPRPVHAPANGLDDLFRADPLVPAMKPSTMRPDLPKPAASTFENWPSITKPKVPAPPDDDDFGDFGDFGLPPQTGASRTSFGGSNVMGSLDDFGDFADLEQAAPKLATKPAAKLSKAQMAFSATVPRHADASSNSVPLAHRSTTELLIAASGQTQRWPAPASPIAPILPPPPNTSAKFDFFADAHTSLPTREPLAKPSAGASPAMARKDGTLSAQDLSFFDSL